MHFKTKPKISTIQILSTNNSADLRNPRSIKFVLDQIVHGSDGALDGSRFQPLTEPKISVTLV